jgi:hypothetical protein
MNKTRKLFAVCFEPHQHKPPTREKKGKRRKAKGGEKSARQMNISE